MSIVIVSGALANKPRSGGGVWERMSWVTGLRRVGCDVYFVEQICPAACVNAECVGTSWRKLLEIARSADLLVNLGGHLTLAPLLECIRRKAYIDVDPGFTQ